MQPSQVLSHLGQENNLLMDLTLCTGAWSCQHQKDPSPNNATDLEALFSKITKQ